ncbi:hypothetical protein Cyrtocomes_00603 [Candidatus Cyrtobacter comes]|uniref:Ysc84 actin-binding domain-containing protein n=1 Tax=Candidatus Cyrtobacter comes TaxID=675776 RepID=A0ABU5L7X9_9RICK|nr:hypothetical protein [Candidatus Cyrtobacter comes]MDZ5762229.1 hypothetical protein [Candidatus Cyrtobacter comes]
MGRIVAVLIATFFLTSCFHTAKQDVADLKSNKVAAIVYNCRFITPASELVNCMVGFNKVENGVTTGAEGSAGWTASTDWRITTLGGLFSMLIVKPGTYRLMNFTTYLIGEDFYVGSVDGMVTDVVVNGGDVVYIGGVEIDGAQSKSIYHGIDTVHYKMDYVIEKLKEKYYKYFGEGSALPTKQLVELTVKTLFKQKYMPILE